MEETRDLECRCPGVGRKIHLEVLMHEIGVLESRFEPHDTGHLRTAVSVLRDRARELAGGGAADRG